MRRPCLPPPSESATDSSQVSAPVVFLLSPAAAYVSGHVLRVDGGSALWGAEKWPIAAHSAMPVYGRMPTSKL